MDDAAAPVRNSLTITAISKAARRRRVLTVALLVAAGCVNYFDRSALAVGNPLIRASLHLSFAQMGLLLAVFAWAYGLAQLPAGAFIGRFGPRRTLGAGMVLWSAAQLAASFVTGLWQFLAARVALGLGESPMYIGGTRVCADWFALPERALPISLFNASSALAPALAPPLLTLLMLGFGWRGMFFAAGLAGLAVAWAWVAFYRAPQDAAIPAHDIKLIEADNIPDPPQGGLLWLLRFPTTWAMFFGFFGIIYVSWLYVTWLPGYLESARHLSLARAGLWSSVPLLAGFAGAVAAGFLARLLVRLGLSPGAACLAPVVGGMGLASLCTMAGALAVHLGPAIALMSAGLFGANIASSCGWALAAIVAPNKAVATLEAVQNIGASMGGALAPLITGLVVQKTGSFTPAFLLAGCIALASAAIYGFGARRPAGT
ncbi:MAG TPA: MFS transporter [Acidocella sp.]|nr:MFS transporter [Acidocella sp.]